MVPPDRAKTIHASAPTAADLAAGKSYSGEQPNTQKDIQVSSSCADITVCPAVLA
ncbi:hypothetical protein PC128_g23824 [Phytophthora cactorum]|nr:hypothetical protein PC128_g23824 [Phytophthora cactorum]